MIKIGSSTSGLGDNLLLTSILKYFPNQLTIQLIPEKKKFSILFKDLATVEITENINFCKDLGYLGEHYSTRKLRNFFGDHAKLLDNRPLVLYSDIESEIWVSEYLKDKKNPVIFVPTCSKTWSDIRNIPVNIANNIFETLKKEYTPIICQSSENYLDIGEHQLIDLDLKKYICLLRRVGIYYGANTGDEHLMAAVGGKTVVFQPEDNEFFCSSEWNYNHPNSIYYRWQKY
jgi:hypothetical protein